MRALRKFCYVTNIFGLHIFDKETVILLNFFEICTEMLFVSLFVLIKRNITTPLLRIHLKYSVVSYSIQNSSSISRLFLNYRSLNMLVLFFLSISCLRLFERDFCQKNYEIIIIFLCKFPKFISRCTPFFYKQSIIDPRLENCLSVSKKSPWNIL